MLKSDFLAQVEKQLSTPVTKSICENCPLWNTDKCADEAECLDNLRLAYQFCIDDRTAKKGCQFHFGPTCRKQGMETCLLSTVEYPRDEEHPCCFDCPQLQRCREEKGCCSVAEEKEDTNASQQQEGS